MKTVMKIGRGLWKSVIGAGVLVFSEGMCVGDSRNRKGCKMKKLFIGLEIVILLAFGLSTALAATVKVLVVAGGGGGAARFGGGGGAGGYQYDASHSVSYQSYTVTVGSGGAGGAFTGGPGTGGANPGVNGNNSVFDTITAYGGGGGGEGDQHNGLDGGSGGGGSGRFATSGGNGSQGSNGGAGRLGSQYCSGGGGGASAAGSDGTVVGGKGGDGTENLITGSSVYYAGGGGGAIDDTTYGSGGNGGGGHGGNHYTGATNGTANTGGGGGGAVWDDDPNGGKGGSGGSGIVIISYVTADFGTCTGGTKTTDGANTVHTFLLADSGTNMIFVAAATPTPTITPTPTRTPTETPTVTPTPTKSMDSPGLPSAGSAMHTLQQVYDYLNSGIKTTPVPSFRGPGAGPGPTMKTLEEIYQDIQAKFDQCPATAADVKSGVRFFSTQSESWGVKTGTGSICP